MFKKIITLLIVLIISGCCLGLISADNNTTDNLTAEDNIAAETIEDLSNFIIPVHITGNGIEFSDGFTGFCIDSSKATITVDDQFTAQPTKNEETENLIKLAIIESYKAGKEDNLGDIVSQVLNGNKEYDVAKAVFNSTETVDDTATVDIDNTTGATFTFELLKSTDDSKSDCLAYKVSMKTVENDAVLGASDNETSQGIDNESANQTGNSQDVATKSTDNGANDTDDKTLESASGANDTDGNATDNVNDTKKANSGETIVNETNKTIITKTNTTIINETNTTIINQNNTKIINKTNETPKNATIQDTIMRAAGNPITILIIVIAIIAIVGVVMKRRQ